MLGILKVIKEKHLIDIKVSQKYGSSLYSLCALAKIYLSPEDLIRFINYLEQSTGKVFNKCLWDRNCDNKDRLNWLDKQIDSLVEKHKNIISFPEKYIKK